MIHLIRTLSLNTGNSYPACSADKTHAKPFGASFHSSSYHKPIAGLKDVERTGHGGEGHGTHEDGHIPGQTAGRGKCELRGGAVRNRRE